MIQSIIKGEDPGPLLAHYQARLAAGMSRHLILSEEFYRTGFDQPWWAKERRSMQQGAEWCAKRVGDVAGFSFQLNGFNLYPVR